MNTIEKLSSDIVLPAGEELVVDLASGGHWYGHGFSHVQPYPLETGKVRNAALAVNNIQCPVWMCSEGVVLFADTTDVLDVSINQDGDGKLRIACPCQSVSVGVSPCQSVLVRVFRGESLPEAHAAWLAHIGWPNNPPADTLFGDALFCTWTQYPRCITQDRILDMARQIRAHGYPCTKLLIDDRWERCFGELSFSDRDFPDPAAMFAELHAMGFEAWLWVTPFVNQEAAEFAKLSDEKILVPSRAGDGAALLRWWGGTAGLVDVTAPQGRNWYRDKLQALVDLGADGFKIDGGDHKYHPPADDCAWHEAPGASGYSDTLLAVFDELVPNACETRTAWLSQGRDILWREGGKDSHWGLDNGLKAMVTLGLHLGLMGYDLLIPDMVPGRVQTMNSDDPLPTDELMIRWTEASAFFPFLQFSYFPWNYCETTATAVLGYAKVHKALESYLTEQSRDRTKPLLRPPWYDWPEEKNLYATPDQWLLGSDLLVAPVLDEAVTARDVTLPPGEWLDAWTGETVSDFLANYPAPCPGIPLFVNSRNTALLEMLRSALGTVPRGSVLTHITTTTWQSGLDRDLDVTG